MHSFNPHSGGRGRWVSELQVGLIHRASSSIPRAVTEKPCLEKTFLKFFSSQGFSVALEAVLELVLIDQAGLELTEICLPLPLPPECWD